MSFHVGQKVVRVSGESEREHAPPMLEVVTICNVYVSDCDCGCGAPLLMIELLEYPAPADGYFLAGWVAHHFRPAVQRKTDIAVFKKLLTPTKPKQAVEA